MKIALDAGHGLYTNGKRSPDGTPEWYYNNIVVKSIMKHLLSYDITIIRLDDPTGVEDIPLDDRDMGAINCAVLVSIHHNSYKGFWGDHTGTETLIQPGIKYFRSKRLAKKINESTIKTLGLKDRGVKKQDTQILRNFKGKYGACMLEVGFLDSIIDSKILDIDANLELVGYNISVSLVNLLSLSEKVNCDINT